MSANLIEDASAAHTFQDVTNRFSNLWAIIHPPLSTEQGVQHVRHVQHVQHVRHVWHVRHVQRCAPVSIKVL